MVVSTCKDPSTDANLVKERRGTEGGNPPLVMRLSVTRFATELGTLQPLTTTYNLLTSPYKPPTNIYMQSMEPVTFVSYFFFTFDVILGMLGSSL